MNARQVLQEVEARGLRLTAVGSDLRLEGPRERMDPGLLGQIRAVKAELAAQLAASAPAEPDGFPLTPLQRGYLLGRGDVFEMGNVASQVYHEIEGAWELERLESALRAVIAHHGQLRTHFTDAGTQVEEAEVPLHPLIERVDLRGLTPPEQYQRRQALRAERSHLILDPGRAPLLAVAVTILADDRMVLHVNHDGLVSDGISMFMFFREWWSGYCGAPADDSEQTPFARYVATLEAARAKTPAQRSREYWLARLDELPPHPALPLRTSPSAISRPRFTRRQVKLAPAAWLRLKERAAVAALTPSCVLLAAYAQTLAAWGAGSRFTINTTVANRPPIHPRIFGAIGNYTDTMLVEVRMDPAAGFAEWARTLQERLRKDLDNRHFSGVDVLRELGRHRGGTDVRMPYTFNSAIGYGDVDGSALELFGPEVYSVSQTPQVWLNVFAMEQHGALVLQLDGVDALFPEGLLDAVTCGYQTMLNGLLDEAAWSAAAFDLLPPEQKARRRQANQTDSPIPPGLLPDRFLAWTQRTPAAPAVITTRATMSYGELGARARQAAAWLRARHLARDELVGLVMTRGPEQIVAILATLMAGGAYLPIDAGLPTERQRYLLRDGRVRCVLTNLSASPPAGLEVLVLDASRLLAAGDVAAVPAAPGASQDDLAYVLYTSGTTGEPKGVMVSHRSVVNVVADCNTRFAISPADRFFAVSAFNFDLSVYDIFGTLTAGAAVVLPDHERAADPGHWLELCGRAGVTVWNSVPAIVSLLHAAAAADGAGPLAALRLVVISGDRIPPRLPATLRRLKGDLEIVSLGGPTETTIWNILHRVEAHEDGIESIPYGRPNANNRAYIDSGGQDAPDWVTGEICAAGAGLARGYWGDPALTARRFIFDERRGELLYRTGDLGCYLPDGSISILGRSDFQLKLNGYRVEAGEVETWLTALTFVKQAVVVRQEGANGPLLAAHLVPSGQDRPALGEIRQVLSEHLPGYLIPTVAIWHDSLPLTRNGKVDRGKLARATPPAPVLASTAPAAAGTATVAEVEGTLTGLWESILHLAVVPPECRLGDLGGDSTAAARIIVGVRRLFGVSIPFHLLPDVDTVRSMAAHIAAARANGDAT